MRKCPNCEKNLEEVNFYGAKIDYCNSCKGFWFDQKELEKAKDEKEESIKWLDIDLWENMEEFKVSEKERQCPACNLPLYELNYGDSEVKVDVCSVCEGVWLDKGEFVKVVDYLKKKAGDDIINNYGKNLLEETKEVFTGPEPLKEEVQDLFVFFGFFKYRFAGKHPFLTEMISKLPKA